MNQFLKHFREVQRGMRLRDVLTLEWVMAVQECLKGLCEGDNIILGNELRRGAGDGRVHIGMRRTQKMRRLRGAKIAPLTITASRPSYVPVPENEVPDGHRRYYLTWGVANGTLPDNRDDCVDLSMGSEENFYIALKCFLNPTKQSIVVTHCEWVTYTQAQKDAGTFDTPDYGADGARPAHLFYLLGMIAVNSSGAATIVHNGGGSLSIREYLADISFAEAGVKYRKALDVTRINY